MPLYEYQCDACGRRFEKIQKFSDPPLETCELCGKGPIQKLISSPAIQFKGTGWYITDYAKKGSTAASETGGGTKASENGTGKASEKSDKAPASEKSDAKPAATTESSTKESS